MNAHRTSELGNPLEPSASVLSKLGSIAVHVQEMLEPGAHSFDVEALKGLIADPEVKRWCWAMDEMALLPVKRDA